MHVSVIPIMKNNNFCKFLDLKKVFIIIFKSYSKLSHI